MFTWAVGAPQTSQSVAKEGRARRRAQSGGPWGEFCVALESGDQMACTGSARIHPTRGVIALPLGSLGEMSQGPESEPWAPGPPPAAPGLRFRRRGCPGLRTHRSGLHTRGSGRQISSVSAGAQGLLRLLHWGPARSAAPLLAQARVRDDRTPRPADTPRPGNPEHLPSGLCRAWRREGRKPSRGPQSRKPPTPSRLRLCLRMGRVDAQRPTP